jgi:hypothetical protein
MTRFKSLYGSVIIASTILPGIVGAIRLDTSYRLPPLGEDRLVNATGRNPHTYIYDSITCDQLQAKKYRDVVPVEDCTQVGTSCVYCDAGNQCPTYVEDWNEPQ